MTRRPRRTHSSAFKAKVALEAVKTVAEIAEKHEVHPTQVTEWRRQLLERATDVFGGDPKPTEPPVDLKALHAKIGGSSPWRMIFCPVRSARRVC